VRPGPDLPAGAFVIDPVFGRAVVVPDRILMKIRADHGAYFTPRRDVILNALAHAHGHSPDPRDGRHRYWHRVPERRRWVFIVVDYDQRSIGQVLTAFPRRRLPRIP